MGAIIGGGDGGGANIICGCGTGPAIGWYIIGGVTGRMSGWLPLLLETLTRVWELMSTWIFELLMIGLRGVLLSRCR